MSIRAVMTSTHFRYSSFTLTVGCAALALLGFGNRARAQDMDQVTVVSSSTHTVGYGLHEPVPIQETQTKVRVTYDPVTLTTNSGVALLKDAVQEAAQKACKPLDLYGSLYSDLPYHDCVRRAVQNAQPQVAQAITKAERAENG